eukprot:NODE_300_length_11422_cov_0.297978.p7 type:complete len:139 gc:universal NODE_300_length_11422_cov_0.297978:4803-5219(+)
MNISKLKLNEESLKSDESQQTLNKNTSPTSGHFRLSNTELNTDTFSHVAEEYNTPLWKKILFCTTEKNCNNIASDQNSRMPSKPEMAEQNAYDDALTCGCMHCPKCDRARFQSKRDEKLFPESSIIQLEFVDLSKYET